MSDGFSDVTFGPDYRAAMEGDNAARQRERSRMFRETVTYDNRQQDMDRSAHCYKIDVHDAHDHERIVWEDPQWVNPRTIWRHRCVGVHDETPYPPVLVANDGGVSIAKQDKIGIAEGFPLARRLMVSSAKGLSGGGLVNLVCELWRKPPREWPPTHIADNGAAINLSREETIALRDYLTTVIDAEEES